MNEERLVLETHETFWQSYARRDLDGRFSVCAPDITFFGTGLHERAVGIAQYRAMNQKGVDQYPHAFTIEYLWKEVHIHGNAAWVEGDTRWVRGRGPSLSKDVVRLTTILKKVDDRWWVAHVHGSDPDYRLHEGEHMTFGNIQARNKDLEREVAERTRELAEEKKRSDELLLNILPAGVADELKQMGTARARQYDQATILFSDFQGFTGISEELTPTELVAELNVCFKAFDHIITARGVEKIKTFGDAYMAAGGLPEPSITAPHQVVHAALEMQAFMEHRRKELEAQGMPIFRMRLGIHTGPVVAGIVGLKKFAYDIWGDTVNIANRLETAGEVDRVNISQTTYALVKDDPSLRFIPRGRVQAKGKGQLEMYFVQPAQPVKRVDEVSVQGLS